MPISRLAAAMTLATALAAQANVDFNRQIKPILSNHCFACHGPDEEERQAKLRLDTYDGATYSRRGRQAIAPGHPEASRIFEHIESDDPDEKMPPPGKGAPLTDEQVALLRQWIAEGAAYDEHWSYKPIVRPEVPSADSQLVENPIDAFLLERLAAESLSFSPEADRYRLARRAAIDITGLPPAPEEVDRFVADPSPAAFAAYLDRLFASPAYGEHMARGWLDIARYADSAGYADDPPRIIWAYRDWVIRAFNANMPFDAFTIAQLAGDLLPEPTEDDLIATAFHRNTLTNSEGGTDDEEFRNAAVVDRVGTTFEAWMGTTMACAQCHTHKYDPITHEDYFRVFAIFNNTEDNDGLEPVLPLLTPAQRKQQADWQQELADIETFLGNPDPAIEQAQVAWEARMRTSTDPWQTLSARSAMATHGVVLEPQSDGSFRAVGEEPPTSTYTLQFALPTERIAALRLEALADPDLQRSGPGRRENFVLPQISARWIPEAPRSPSGRFVRIELVGEGKMIHLAELQVFSGSENIALWASASQSSTDFGGDASRAIDGNTDGNYQAGSVSHTAVSANPWFELDLGTVRQVDRIVVWNRTDGGTTPRLAGYRVMLLDDQRNPVWEVAPAEIPEPSASLHLTGERPLRIASVVTSHAPLEFPAEAWIDSSSPTGSVKGWSLALEQGTSHEVALALESPIEEAAGWLEISLTHESLRPHHALGRFRISFASDAESALERVWPSAIRAILATDAAERSLEESEALARYFRSITPMLAEPRKTRDAIAAKLASIQPMTSVPVMRELPADRQRTTRVQLRGNFLNVGDEVKPGVPSAFPPLPEGEPANRLSFAKWLVDPRNPLTARATVNRLWEGIFGTGIVATGEDFGAQGDLPSHPELLDWLAAEFIASGWDIQHMIRLMVSSRAYRQTSRVTPEILEIDPSNRLLSRGPSIRLTAEEMRDQALAASGLLSREMFGPPVRPPRPSFGLVAAFGGSTDWQTSTGSDRYRRGLYTEIRRSSPHPSMTTFDATSREVCSLSRSRSNTPLQALVTLNDPAFVEAAQALARRMSDGQLVASTEQRITAGFRRVIARPPAEAELAALRKLFEQARDVYAANFPAALEISTNPLGPLPDGMDAVVTAAWTAVAQALLNMDEAFQKY
jgi:mono/diheme cytochrome c family protein